MIPAQKGGLFTWVLDRYVSRKVRTAFRGVWLKGELPTIDQGTVVYANHSTFWDGFIVHQLCREAGWDGYCLMEEHNLARYRFLTRIGAFSIRRHEAASALETLRYAKRLLERPRAVFVFPEGELHGQARTLQLERGVEVLARSAQATCLPVAFRCAFFEHELPDVVISVGESHPPAPIEGFAVRLEALRSELFRLESPHGLRRLIEGRRGVAQRWGAFRGRPRGKA